MIQNKKIIIAVTLSLALLQPIQAQLVNEAEYRVSTGIALSQGSNSPLYLNSNKQGVSSIEKNSGYVRGMMKAAKYLDNDSLFTLGAALDVVVASHFTNDVFFQQFYADLGYKWLNLSVGLKERYSELKDRELSNGGLSFSGNARPIPQIRLEIPHYVTLPFWGDWFHVRGHLAYGRFTDDDWKSSFTQNAPLAIYQKDVLYHSKAGFLKIENKEKFPLSFEIGLEMYAQFGGSVYNHSSGKLYDMPSGIADYFKTFIPMGGDDSTSKSEQSNVEGNQLGSWHFSLKYSGDKWSARAYREQFFEDHSQLFSFEIQKNREGERKPIYYGWKDGLTGIEIALPKNNFVNKIVYEYLYTKQQSGAGYHDPGNRYPEQVAGIDWYFNHSIYSAWQHYGQAIGNPIIISPQYNENGFITFASNRVVSHHIGFNGDPLPSLSYRFMFTHTRHWGTYFDPLKSVEKEMNYLMELSYRPSYLKGWSFTLSGAADHGTLTGDNTGVLLTIGKCGFINL